MPSEHVRVELGALSRIVLCRPDKHNAMTPEMGRAIAEAVVAINARDDVRVVLVQGEGRAFSSGGDFSLIEQNSAKPAEQNQREMPAFYASFLSVIDLRVPSIAVIHGAAVGAGLCLAMACDLRLAAREAKLGANFVRVGLHPGMGASLLLPRLVGPAKAAELILTGRLVTGSEAEQIGLVNLAVPRDELSGVVDATAAELAAAAPIAVAQAKETLSTSLRAELGRALEREAACQAVGFASEDLKEAIAAFHEGRPPAFRGR